MEEIFSLEWNAPQMRYFCAANLIKNIAADNLGGFTSTHQGIIQKVAGIGIIFFGFSIAGVFKIPFLMRSRQFLPIKTGITGYLGSVIIGISFGAARTPCIGPILGAILALASGAKSMSQGVILLTAYSLGFAAPFLLAVWASS